MFDYVAQPKMQEIEENQQQLYLSMLIMFIGQANIYLQHVDAQ